MVLDWGPMVVGIRQDLRRGESRAMIARKFHNPLVTMMLRVARGNLQRRRGSEDRADGWMFSESVADGVGDSAIE